MSQELESIVQLKPVLWVGAGLSVAAGAPTTEAILSELRAVADRELPSGEFTAVVDAFVEAMGSGELGDVLQRLFQIPRAPTPIHHAIARLARAGRFTALVTTNYDDLLEQSLASNGVKVVVQTIDRNGHIKEKDGAVRLLKIHGSFSDWKNTIFSGRSHADFDGRHEFLRAQLMVLLQQNPLLFVGCSLQDPRLLRWIESRDGSWANELKRWRAMMRGSTWDAALARPWRDGTAGAVLTRAPLKPILLGGYDELTARWLELAEKLAPPIHSKPLFFIEPLASEEQGGLKWRVTSSFQNIEPHVVDNPLQDPEFLLLLSNFASTTRHHSKVALGDHPSKDARAIGLWLTNALFSAETQKALHERIRNRLELSICVCSKSDAGTLLGLPWELLLCSEDGFPVFLGKLDIARELVGDRPSGPAPPDREATLYRSLFAGMVSSPSDRRSLEHEEEIASILWAFDAHRQSVQFAELGQVTNLLDLVGKTTPRVLHLTCHVIGDILHFENSCGFTEPIHQRDFATKLRMKFLRAPGESVIPEICVLALVQDDMVCEESSPRPFWQDRVGLEVALQEAGVDHVVSYRGCTDNALRRRVLENFYLALAAGKSLVQAVSDARQCPAEVASNPINAESHSSWINLLLFTRGETPRLRQLITPHFSRIDIPPNERPVLIGRRLQLHQIACLVYAGQRLILLQGGLGSGRTTLGKHLVAAFTPHERSGIILRVQPGAMLDYLSMTVDEHAKKHGIKLWAADEERRASISDPIERLEQAIHHFSLRIEKSLVLFIDDFDRIFECSHNNPGDTKVHVSPLSMQLWGALRRLSDRCLIFVSTSIAWKGAYPAQRVAIPMMRSSEMYRIIQRFPNLSRLEPNIRRFIADSADGRPRTLDLLDKLLHDELDDCCSDGEGASVARRLESIKSGVEGVLDAIWGRLASDARAHMPLIARISHDIPREVVHALGNSCDELSRCGFLIPIFKTKPVRFTIPADVRRFVATRSSSLSTDQILTIAKAMSDHIFKTLVVSPLDAECVVVLLLDAGRPEAIGMILRHCIASLYETGGFSDASRILSLIPESVIHGDDLAWVRMKKIQVDGCLGRIGDGEACDRLRKASVVATSLNVRIEVSVELGDLLVRQGKIVEADSELMRTLELATSSIPRGGEMVANLLRSCGGVKTKLGQYPQAERLLKQALDSMNWKGANESLLYYSTMLNLASLVHTMDRRNEAMELFSRTVEGAGKHLGWGSSIVALAFGGQAKILTDECQLLEAIARLDVCRRLQEQAFCGEHYLMADTLHHLARLDVLADQAARAAELHNKAITLRTVALGGEHRSVAASYRELGMHYLRCNEFAPAVDALQHSVDIYQKNEEVSLGSILTLELLKKALMSIGRFSDAEIVLLRWLEGLDVASADFLQVSMWLAELYCRQGRNKEGRELFVGIHRRLVENAGADDPMCALASQYLAAIECELGIWKGKSGDRPSSERFGSLKRYGKSFMSSMAEEINVEAKKRIPPDGDDNWSLFQLLSDPIVLQWITPVSHEGRLKRRPKRDDREKRDTEEKISENWLVRSRRRVQELVNPPVQRTQPSGRKRP